MLSTAPCVASNNSNGWIHGLYTGLSPRPTLTSEAEAWRQAGALADKTPAAFVLAGSGQSMHPLYTTGTILVLRQMPYARLKCGQTVLYRTKQHKIVAHLLVAKTRDGWRTQGLNNPIHDMEPIGPENFVGVVIAAFQPAGSDRSMPLVTLR